MTVIFAVPTTPSTDALICTVPGDAPVTTPVFVTVAIELFRELHVTALPVIAVPVELIGVALNCTVVLTSTVGPFGVTETEAAFA